MLKTNKEFPIMYENYRSKSSIPWSVIAPHEAQAIKNHGGQTLQRLAERGGLAWSETAAVLEDRKWHKMDESVAKALVTEIVNKNSELL